MKRAGLASTKNAALLLSSAALVDLFLVFVVAYSITPSLSPYIWKLLPFVDPAFHSAVVFFVATPLFWVITELLFRGRSPGRFLHGLQLRRAAGRSVARHWLFFRLLHKLMFYGLGGINPIGQSRYDRLFGVQWYTPLCPPPRRPVHEWDLTINSGRLRGASVTLGRFKGGKVKIGRDKNWANIRLAESDVNVSRRHCVLSVSKGKLWVTDGDGEGRPSSTGTWVGSKRLRPSSTASVGSAQLLKVGDVEIQIDR